MRALPTLAVVVALASGCVSQRTWSPVVDPYGDPNAEYIGQDESECRDLAVRASGNAPEQTFASGLFGGLFGAATGAVIGAVAGDPGAGAAIGGASGGFSGLTFGALDANYRFQDAFRWCMHRRGHHVIG